MPDSPASGPLDPEFIALLRCLKCPDRPPLTLSAEGDRLVCAHGAHTYPILDGLPDLRPETATLTPTETPQPCR